MSEEIMEQPSGKALSEQGRIGRGFQHFRVEDALLPRIRLNGKTGVFVSNLEPDDEGTATLRFVPLLMTRSRTMFVEEGDDNIVAVCRSPDGDQPTWSEPGFWTEPRPTACMACKYAQWGADKTPPQCDLFWNFLGVSLGNQMPFVFSARRTAIMAAKKMMSVLKASGNDLFAAEVTLGSKEAGSGTKTYSRLTFDGHRWLEQEELGLYEELYSTYVEGNDHLAEMLSGVQSENVGDEDGSPF